MLTDEQQMLVREVTSIAENEFAEKAFEWEEKTPWENVKFLADRGFMGINLAEDYGGGGMTEFEAMLIGEAIARVCPDTGRFVTSQSLISPRAIEMFGSESIKEKYLPRVTNGEEYIAIAISEPHAGSDVQAMNTTIKKEGDRLVMNGEKIWVSDAPDASAAVVWAKFPEGLGSVVVDFDDPGIEFVNHSTNMGGVKQSQFFIEDVEIPEENVLTRRGEAFKEQLKSLNWERLAGATIVNAIGLCAMDKALEYAKQREQFDQSVADFQGIEWKFADMIKQVEASRTLTFRTAKDAIEAGRVPDPMQTQIATLFAVESVQDVVDEGLQIHGAPGYQQGHPLEYLYRLARGYRIAGGTDEILKNRIAALLKDQGPPSFLE